MMNQFNNWSGAFAKTASGGIPARSGATAGVASDVVFCTIGNDGSITETSSTLRVFNPFQTAIAGSTFITIKPINGTHWIVDAEDCPSS